MQYGKVQVKNSSMELHMYVNLYVLVQIEYSTDTEFKSFYQSVGLCGCRGHHVPGIFLSELSCLMACGEKLLLSLVVLRRMLRS